VLKGLLVDAYRSPQAMLKLFKANAYDLAILDIRMPVLSGLALYREMKKLTQQLLPASFLLLKFTQMSLKRYFHLWMVLKPSLKNPYPSEDY